MVKLPEYWNRTKFVSTVMNDVRKDLETVFTKEGVEENIRFLKSLATQKYFRKSRIKSSPRNLVRHVIREGYVVKTSRDRYTITDDGRSTASGIMGTLCYAAAHKRNDPNWGPYMEQIDSLIKLIDKK